MFYGQVLITENKVIAPGYYRLSLMALEVASQAKPGQFIQLKVSGDESVDPLLARPISLYRIDPAGNQVSLIYRVVGRGTARLAVMKQGEQIEIFGPIGNGFEIPTTLQNIALIAGGVGMPPLYCITESMQYLMIKPQISLFYGGRSQSDLLELSQWEALKVPVYSTTEDGSFGHKGFVTELFIEKHQQLKYDFIIACGPTPMLQAVQKIAIQYKVAGLLSLEANMACGVGACLGCTCNTALGYRRVCIDGPVFPIQEVVW